MSIKKENTFVCLVKKSFRKCGQFDLNLRKIDLFEKSFLIFIFCDLLQQH